MARASKAVKKIVSQGRRTAGNILKDARGLNAGLRSKRGRPKKVGAGGKTSRTIGVKAPRMQRGENSAARWEKIMGDGSIVSPKSLVVESGFNKAALSRGSFIFFIPTMPAEKHINFSAPLKKAMQRAVKDIKQMLSRTTATWDHKVTFYHASRDRNKNVIRSRYYADSIESHAAEVEFFVNDDVWNYLNRGTNTRKYVMGLGFQPKTLPGTLDSFPGNDAGSWFDISGSFAPPGIAARNWVNLIVNQYEGIFDTLMFEAQEEAIRKAGL